MASPPLAAKMSAGRFECASFADSPSTPLPIRVPASAAQCPASEVLFVGTNVAHDITGPMQAGIRHAWSGPHKLQHGEVLPDGALLIRHVHDLPTLPEAG
jgi:hypothetical protein